MPPPAGRPASLKDYFFLVDFLVAFFFAGIVLFILRLDLTFVPGFLFIGITHLL